MPHDERKVTEDLLSGFDRTGRTPRVPPVRPQDPRRAEPTVSVRPPKSASIWPWIGMGVVFLLTIVTVVMLALPDTTPKPPPVASVSAPLPSAGPVATVAPVAPIASVSAPLPSAEPVAAPSASPPPRPAAAPPPKPSSDQRVDFVRKL